MGSGVPDVGDQGKAAILRSDATGVKRGLQSGPPCETLCQLNFGHIQWVNYIFKYSKPDNNFSKEW